MSRRALQLVQGGVIVVAILWSLGMVLDLAMSVTNSAQSTLCSEVSSLPADYQQRCGQ